MALISVEKVKKIFRMGEVEVQALRGIDMQIQAGEFVAIMGASGSGKSTLMNIIGCLDVVTSGNYFLDGVLVSNLPKRNLAEIRNLKIGFVFQNFNLLPRTSALENVELPLIYDRSGRFPKPKQRAIACLNLVGLGDRMHHEPNQLSGGQRQRVAIARALVNNPAIILADEPTGNLDTATSLEVMAVFQELNDAGHTIILVTHEEDISRYAKRIIVLRDGCVKSDHAVENRLRYDVPRNGALPEAQDITTAQG